METEIVDRKFIDGVIQKWSSDPSFLIPMMQDIQGKYNYLPRPALVYVQEKLQLPLTRVSEVATFYRAFSLKPKGKHIIHVCLGTACHLKGGPRIVDAFKRELNVEVDETTKDNEFTLQTVNCVGACALAPVVIIDGNVIGRQEPSKAKALVAKARPQAVAAPAPAPAAAPKAAAPKPAPVKAAPAKPVKKAKVKSMKAKKTAPKKAAPKKAAKPKKVSKKKSSKKR
jgi:NADH-quinone oxidoreductase subunit E